MRKYNEAKVGNNNQRAGCKRNDVGYNNQCALCKMHMQQGVDLVIVRYHLHFQMACKSKRSSRKKQFFSQLASAGDEVNII